MTTLPDIEISPERREVRVDGAPVSLGARAFDVLAHLAGNAGEVVSKQELLEAVWGGLAVEEGNLTVQISALRKALGPEAIRTVPGVGYLLAQGTPPPAVDGPALPDMPSVAVLPFANLTGDAQREYFVDGMATDLIAALSRNAGLFVIAATSSFRYKGRSVDLAAVGRELGVRYLLEGAVQQSGPALRVTIQLVVADTAHTIWSERFEGTADDLFALQDDLTEKVSAAIEPKLMTAEARRSASKPTESLKAYDLYLQASALLDGVPTIDFIETAVPLLERAIEMDPGFARAKSLMCMAYMRARGARLISHERAMDVFDLADDLIRENRDDPYVLAGAGMTHAYLSENKAQGAQAVRKAVALAPNSHHVLNIAGWTLSYVGDYGPAIDYLEKSLRLDPIGPLSTYARAGYGAALMFSGRAEDAIDQLEQCRAASPEFGAGLQWLMMAYWSAGREGDAARIADDLRRVVPDIGLAATRQTTPHRRPEQIALLEAAFRGVGLPE